MPKRMRDYHQFLLEELSDPIFAAEYLNEARKESRQVFLKAMRNVAEARRMAVVATQTGLNRESLYKSLSEGGNPCLDTYDSVLNALGLDYVFTAKSQTPVTPPGPSPVLASTKPKQIEIESTDADIGALTATYTCMTPYQPVQFVPALAATCVCEFVLQPSELEEPNLEQHRAPAYIDSLVADQKNRSRINSYSI